MKNVFIQTENARNFITALKESENIEQDPVLIGFTGPAGRGKTETARYYAAQEGWSYVRALTGWSDLWMIQDILFNLGHERDRIPGRKKACFEIVVEILNRTKSTIIIDDADKLNALLLDWVRDLADVTFTPFALVGENLLRQKMEKERRIWSRTLRVVEFKPITSQDIMFFAKQAADLKLSADQVEVIRVDSEGDFRLVKRNVRHLEEIVKGYGTHEVTDKMVQAAIKRGFRGK